MDAFSFIAGAYITVGLWAVSFTIGWGVATGIKAAGFGRNKENDL